MRRPAVLPALGAACLALAAPAGLARKPIRGLTWQQRITARDRVRLREWREAWRDGLAQATSGGAAAAIAAEGALLQPDAALEQPLPPDGDYRCRLLKLGAQGTSGQLITQFGTRLRGSRADQAPPGAKTFLIYPTVPCRVGGGQLRMLAGVQRLHGYLWTFDGIRQLFLGSVALGDEHGGYDYGRDSARDAVGLLERVGERRWRLVLPRPTWQSILDVVEVVPAAS